MEDEVYSIVFSETLCVFDSMKIFLVLITLNFFNQTPVPQQIFAFFIIDSKVRGVIL